MVYFLTAAILCLSVSRLCHALVTDSVARKPVKPMVRREKRIRRSNGLESGAYFIERHNVAVTPAPGADDNGNDDGSKVVDQLSGNTVGDGGVKVSDGGDDGGTVVTPPAQSTVVTPPAKKTMKELAEELRNAALAAAENNGGPVPKDPHDGKVQAGHCGNWEEGSSVRELAEGTSQQSDGTMDECWAKCDREGTCQQAEFISMDGTGTSTICKLGINTSDSVLPADCPDAYGDCTSNCYAKNGFGHTLTFDVQPGFCEDWNEGFNESGVAVQCDLDASAEAQAKCSHWGAEYDVSERGCWVKCAENEHCMQAVYEDKDGSWSCWIGTQNMTQDAGPSRCPTCNNKCFGKHGFNNAVVSTVSLNTDDTTSSFAEQNDDSVDDDTTSSEAAQNDGSDNEIDDDDTTSSDAAQNVQ